MRTEELQDESKNGSLIQLKVADGIAWITLSRPKAMNAVNRALIAGLEGALISVQADHSVRVVVITGSGRAFCAGGDLKEFLNGDGSIDQKELLKFVQYAGSVFERVSALTKPVIAAVNGFALAGGLELALSCDLVLAAESARLGDGHSNYGLLPGGGGAARLVRVVGPMVAKYLAFTGDALPAADLVPLGLVNEVVPDDRLLSRANEVAARIASKSPVGLAAMKALINDGLDQSLPVALRAEHQALAAHMYSEDMHEGLTAFREKRKPNYTTTL